MKLEYDTDRVALRHSLLDKVEDLREVAVAYAEESEALETLAPPVVEAMRESGIWGLKLPAELGGVEADPGTQMEIIEAMTRIDTSAGWALMIGATSIGWPGAYLPEAGARRMFSDPDRLPTAAGNGGVFGTAVAVDGGFRVSGRFLFGSGIRHAEWVLAGSPVTRDGEVAESRSFMVPAEQAQVHLDSWHVAGLRGTGSCDYTLDDVFVPEEMSWDRTIMTSGMPERGGAIFRLGMPAYTANEHAAFALGCARRALDTVQELGMRKSRRTATAFIPIADRQVFQSFVGAADVRLKTVRAGALELYDRVWQVACEGEVPGPLLQSEMRAMAIVVTETCVNIVNQAFRFAGGGSLQANDPLQRYWRDITAAGQHMAVSNAGLEAYGQLLLGFEPGGPGVAQR